MPDKRLDYPMTPKSADWLLPGHFWALPLRDGTFGCGRVVEVPAPPHRPNRNVFLAAVLDWHGADVPTSEAIAGAPCLAQGKAHIRAITRTGGAVLGHRDLAADEIEPWLFRGAAFYRNSSVFKGCTPVRPQTPEDSGLPVLGGWSITFAIAVAEARFGLRADV